MIELERDEIAAGDVLAGKLGARPDCGPGQEVTVWLVWRILAVFTPLDMLRRVDANYSIVDTCPLPGTDLYFSFRIPERGPLTYDGTLFRVMWEVVAGTTSGPDQVSVAAHRLVRVRARPVARFGSPLDVCAR
jgi:hypothetical protein